MCIGFPGKIISINEDNYAEIDIGGTKRDTCLDILGEDTEIGDYVICHAGFAIHKIDHEEAHERLKLLKVILEKENEKSIGTLK